MNRFVATRMALAGLSILVAGGLASASAGVYKWVDANGVIHYGDQPAQNSSGAEKVRDRSRKPVSKPEKPAAKAASLPGNSADDSASTTTAALESEIRAQECTRAQTRLASYREADRLILTNQDGTQEEMSPDARVAAIARVSQHVEALCRQ